MLTNFKMPLALLVKVTVVSLMLSFSVHASTVLKNCFSSPQDYTVSYERELSAAENIAGSEIVDNMHLLGNGAEMEANCSCVSDMEESTSVMEMTLAGSPLSAGASGYGYLNDVLDIHVSGYSDAINSPDGANLTKLEVFQYPTPRSSMQKKVENIKTTEGTASVCSNDTRPAGEPRPKRMFKWNVIAANFLIKKPILGVISFPPTLVVQNYACIYISGSCAPSDAELVSNIWLSGTISAPLSCTINEGSTIEVDFGELVSSQFVAKGQQPKGYTLKDVDISYHCDDNAIGSDDRIKLTLTADQGVVDSSDPVIAKMVGREDIGVKVYNEDNLNIALDGTYEFPVTIDEQGNGLVRIKATPVSTLNEKPQPGSFEGNVTVKMDLR
ncbi:fimbrial protein [Enterobacter sp. 168J2]|uniref:fimbrial protein n=1 Tax=Enterobacter sp. 168J2 TaxID=3077758 RepID=UPI002A80AFF4|nr:fimbrial protein [Enterobacter sp. 168J2]